MLVGCRKVHNIISFLTRLGPCFNKKRLEHFVACLYEEFSQVQTDCGQTAEQIEIKGLLISLKSASEKNFTNFIYK